MLSCLVLSCLVFSRLLLACLVMCHRILRMTTLSCFVYRSKKICIESLFGMHAVACIIVFARLASLCVTFPCLPNTWSKYGYSITLCHIHVCSLSQDKRVLSPCILMEIDSVAVPALSPLYQVLSRHNSLGMKSPSCQFCFVVVLFSLVS
jgi:hypothetical protein